MRTLLCLIVVSGVVISLAAGVEPCGQLCRAIVASPGATEKAGTATITLHVRGMMKSRSGAT